MGKDYGSPIPQTRKLIRVIDSPCDGTKPRFGTYNCSPFAVAFICNACGHISWGKTKEIAAECWNLGHDAPEDDTEVIGVFPIYVSENMPPKDNTND